MKKVLVIGKGGREHALAYHLKQSPEQSEVYCAPGNVMMAADGIQCIDIAETDSEALASFCLDHDIDWSIVGGEAPLNVGIVDEFQKQQLKIIGPTKAAAQLESSKSFAKDIMSQCGVLTADSTVFNDYRSALAYTQSHSFPTVIKKDGLAAGKGVTIATDQAMAQATLQDIYHDDAEATVVIEEYLEGEELSIFTLVGEDTVIHAGVAQDYKRAYDHGVGPNTGGMGAITPVPNVNDELVVSAYEKIIYPVLDQMKANGTPFTGVLYSGLMRTKKGLAVIEFNTRFGDPETQVIMHHMNSSLFAALDAIVNNQSYTVSFEEGYSLGVVVAAEGYPHTPKKGFELGQLISGSGIKVYGAGISGNQTTGYQAAGGRLFMPVVQSQTLSDANRKVCHWIDELAIPHTFHRTDIGQ